MVGTTSQPGFEALMKGLDQTVLVLNGVGEISRVHEGSAEWLNGDKLIDITLFSLLEAKDVDRIKALFDESISSKNAQQGQLTLKPEHLLQWREAGLSQQRVFDVTFVASTDEEVICVFKDVSESKQLTHKISQQSQRDLLTGAYNRRSLLTVLQQSVAQAQRYDWICSFLIIDIDHFSDINDQHGLDAGDQVLQAFVTALHGFKRTADFFARYSDDKFVMFLPETNQDQAMLAAERVRVLAENLEIPYSTGNLSFTVSIGISTLMFPEDNPEVMLKRAEENLFVAKQSGSNRIEGEPD